MEGIQRESAAAAPREACGLLFGSDEEITGWEVTANVAEEPERHFEIDPAALFAALRAERAGGPGIAGYWHSHPSGSVRPSHLDATSAPDDGKLWVIVAGDDIAAWRLVHNEVFGWTESIPERMDDGTLAMKPTSIGVMPGFDRVPLITGNVRHLMPFDKCDEAVVPLLAEAGYPAIAPLLDDLLGWTADLNWPVAWPIAQLLVSLGDPIVAPLHRALRGDDGDLKQGCLNGIVRRLPPAVREPLLQDLIDLAERSSVSDREGGVDEIAREILDEWAHGRA